MSKIKLNPNLASVLLLMGLIVGWQYLILAVLFVFLCCDEDESLKQMAIKVIALMAACALFSAAWSVIESGYTVVKDVIWSIFEIIFSIDNTVEMPEFVTIIFTGILDNVVSVIGSAIGFLVLFTKVSFVVSVVTNKAFKKPFGKLDEYLTNFSAFILNKVSPKTSSTSSTTAE